MMKQEFKIDDLIRSAVKERQPDQLSDDFSDKVMAFIKQEAETANSSYYRPLFSKKTWTAITGLVAGIIVLLFVFPGNSGEMFSGFKFMDSLFGQIQSIQLPFRLSGPMLMILVCAGIMFFMQIFILGKFIRRNIS